MSAEQLGKALAEARTARGLTLHDVERDTRISGKYLQALEEGRLDVLPAPVYARAFTRTYAQYLGLNAREFVQQLPGAKPEPELPPLPAVGREHLVPLISASWLAAAGVVVLLLIVGLVLFWNRGGGEESTVRGGPPAVVEPTGEGAEEVVPPEGLEPEPVVLEPGVVPDLEERHVLIAIDALSQAGLRYVIIEVLTDDVPAETVFLQSPTPGTSVDEGDVVTLMVGRE